MIVIAPAGILLCGMISLKFFNLKGFELILTILITITTFYNFFVYKKDTIHTIENIEWVVERTYNKNCKNLPVYFNDNKKSF